MLVGTNVIRACKKHFQYLHRIKESHLDWYTAVQEIGDTDQSETDDMVGPAVCIGHKICTPAGKEIW